MIKISGKELAKAGAGSALSSLVPSVATKMGTNLTTKAGAATLGGLVPKVATSSSSPNMMKLYRGLTQKYDPNYPVAKLDTSGYESWTDNLDLARQYGDNVYSIEVPKTDIKTSYLDENPNSPTYGDRNPIYRIDKKAGLNGVSGNEYLLEVGSPYQKGLIYNEVPSELETAIKNSGVSPETANRAGGYLGGLMVDKSGKPITFYHSTPYEFDKFDDSKLGQNTNYTTGRTMELYAKAKKPIIHPYLAGQKYPQEQLDDILKNWIRAISDSEETANEIIQDYVNAANETRELMENSGQVYDTKSPLWDEYMNQTFMDTDPYEYSADDRKALLRNGYDAVEIVEGPKSGLVEGSKDDSVVSSYAILNGNNLSQAYPCPAR